MIEPFIDPGILVNSPTGKLSVYDISGSDISSNLILDLSGLGIGMLYNSLSIFLTNKLFLSLSDRIQ